MIPKIFYWLDNLSRYKKQLIMIFVDMVFLESAIFFSYSLRKAAWFWPDGDIEKLIYLSPFLSIPIFYYFGMYQSIVRYMGMKAILHIFYAVTLYMIIWSSFGYYLNINVAHSVLIYHDNGTIYKVNEYFSSFLVLSIINWLISIILIGSSRIFVREIYWGIKDGIFKHSYKRKNILIYGAGDAGIQLANALNFSKELKVCAFIDDNKNIQNKIIYGLKIFNFKKLNTLIKSLKITEIMIAIPSIENRQKMLIIKKISKFPIKVSIIPGISEIAEGKIKLEDIKSLKIEDILFREKVPPVNKLLIQNINNQNIIITGAGGSIGSELSRNITGLKPNLVVLYEQSEFALYEIERELKANMKDKNFEIISVLGDICNQKKLLTILKKYKIDIFFHAAAYKHVPLVEKNIKSAIENNYIGTKNVIDVAIENKCQNFVLISTDKAVSPSNIMGATKRLSEMYVQAINNHHSTTSYSIVRFGNVLGSSGSVVPLFTNQINSGGPITVTSPDVTRYFMTIPEATSLILKSTCYSKEGNIFVLDMGKPVKILDLAKKIIKLSGHSFNSNDENSINIEFTGLRPGEKMHEELYSINENVSQLDDDILLINDKGMNMSDYLLIHAKLESILESFSEKKAIKFFEEHIDGFVNESNG